MQAWGAVLAGFVMLGATLPARGDILHLKSGGSVEGAIVERDAESYKVRTIVGTVTVPVDAVARLEERPSILDEYVQRRERVADTPAAQVELAVWCEEQGLDAAWRTHLKRALKLDPDYAPAREALGFVRVGGIWVEGRTTAERPEASDERQDAAQRDVADRDSAQVVAAIQSQWNIRIRAIKKNKLSSGSERLVRAGRESIVEIRDPLAILPLVRMLGKGNWACREALVEVLGHFPQDEATMNLAILALTEPDDGLRLRALQELRRRDDPRVIPQFRRALATDNDALTRRAAIALGALEATAAVPDLIEVLKAQRYKRVEVSAQSYFQQYPLTFGSPFVMWHGYVRPVRCYPTLTNADIGVNLVTMQRQYEMRNVTVFRTEVLEALKLITGVNFGFDEAAWRRWYKEQQP